MYPATCVVGTGALRMHLIGEDLCLQLGVFIAQGRKRLAHLHQLPPTLPFESLLLVLEAPLLVHVGADAEDHVPTRPCVARVPSRPCVARINSSKDSGGAWPAVKTPVDTTAEKASVGRSSCEPSSIWRRCL